MSVRVHPRHGHRGRAADEGAIASYAQTAFVEDGFIPGSGNDFRIDQDGEGQGEARAQSTRFFGQMGHPPGVIFCHENA